MTLLENSVCLILGVPAAAHWLIAEMPGPTVLPDWIGSATQISAFGLVAWIVYYMFSKWLPAIQGAHSDQLAAQREAHTAAMEGIADAHKIAMQSIAEAHKAAVEKMTMDFKDCLSVQRADLLAIRAICKAETHVGRPDAGQLKV